IPKDGPSAGVTLATAMASALMRVPVRKEVAMTGEITLRGRVLPVGGIKEKLLAAHRLGVTMLILPKDNEKDLTEVDAEVRAALDIRLVETIDEVLALALEEACPTDVTATDAATPQPPIWTPPPAQSTPTMAD
ncbi:MAG TPA: S16 family serine protease, partial [Pyrinomonadaceae bacterium]|nr:S16 family serine protease [Pyrinomonadaceae bacterium]